MPWVWDGDASTAIPELHDWRLAREDERYLIINRRPDGTVERYWDMAFDGSPGPSMGRTREHFPELHDWRLSDASGQASLINTRADGTVETFSNIVFHGGPGLALEMRLFTKAGIEENLRVAGFGEIGFEMQDRPEFGIIFGHPWSRPVARTQDQCSDRLKWFLCGAAWQAACRLSIGTQDTILPHWHSTFSSRSQNQAARGIAGPRCEDSAPDGNSCGGWSASAVLESRPTGPQTPTAFDLPSTYSSKFGSGWISGARAAAACAVVITSAGSCLISFAADGSGSMTSSRNSRHRSS